VKRSYTVLIERGPTSFGATVPDLPGCVAVAKSRRGVLKLIAEAITAHVASMETDGDVVPEPVHEAVVIEVGETQRKHRRPRAGHAGPQFERHIGIDYSGAETRTSSKAKTLRHTGRPPGLKRVELWVPDTSWNCE